MIKQTFKRLFILKSNCCASGLRAAIDLTVLSVFGEQGREEGLTVNERGGEPWRYVHSLGGRELSGNEHVF